MFRNLGIQWAASIAGFLALLCLPLPYIFWKYGASIRAWSKYSSEGIDFKNQMPKPQPPEPEINGDTKLPMNDMVEHDEMKSIWL